VRKLKVLRKKETTTREIEETTQITSVTYEDGRAANDNNVTENKAVKVGKENVQVKSVISDVYKVEVEDAQTFNDDGTMVKFSTLNKKEDQYIF